MKKLDEKSINEKNNEKYKRPDSQMPVRTGYDYPVILSDRIIYSISRSAFLNWKKNRMAVKVTAIRSAIGSAM